MLGRRELFPSVPSVSIWIVSAGTVATPVTQKWWSGEPASLGEVGRRDVPLGRTQGGHAHVEGIGALLDLDLPIGFVGEFRESGIFGEALT